MPIPGVIDQLYASALDEAQWASAMRSVAAFCGATASGYVAVNPAAGAIVACQTVDIDPSFVLQYLQHYAPLEIRLPPALPYPVGTVMTESMLLPKSTLERSEIYNDLLLPCEVPHFMFAWLRKRPELLETVALESSLHRGPLGEFTMSRYRMLLPHIGRALEVRRRLQGLQLREHACFYLLEALPFGVLMLSATGEVVAGTNRAHSMLGTSGVLRLRLRRLHATNSRADQRLQRALACATDIRPGRTRLGDSIRLSGPADRALVVTVVPIVAPVLGHNLPDIAALALLVEPGVTAQPESMALQKVLELTASEADLACRLFNGESLAEASRNLGRATSTCRTQLKSIFRRTGCRGQSELIKLIASVLIAGSMTNYTSHSGDTTAINASFRIRP
jgi:DNA-binding CsgD family transcriptional regulator